MASVLGIPGGVSQEGKAEEAESAAISGADIAKDLLADYGQLVAGLREGIAAAQEANDEVSADLMIGSLAEYEKTIWMLDAFLK